MCLEGSFLLICRQVDDAVGDHDIHAVVEQWNRLDDAFQELDILDTGLPAIVLR